MDMTNGFDSVFNFILDGMRWVFDILDKVTFHGISLLDFFITLFILGIAVPLVISTVQSRPTEAYNAARYGASKAKEQWNKHPDYATRHYDEWD